METLNGEDFLIWKKEICAIEVNDKLTDFKRLEFLMFENYGKNEPEYILKWLEPTIHDGKPALILHCTLDK
jgi:uncharacterized protein (UPF0128 family)